MRLAVASLAVVAALTLAADQALAERTRALSYPMAAHTAAKYGVHHPGQNREVMRNMHAARDQQARHGSSRHHGQRNRYGHGSHYRPVVVVPSPWMYNQYYAPYRGFYYFAPASAFGFGF